MSGKDTEHKTPQRKKGEEINKKVWYLVRTYHTVFEKVMKEKHAKRRAFSVCVYKINTWKVFRQLADSSTERVERTRAYKV